MCDTISGMTLTINLENHEAIETMTEGFGLRLALHEVGSFPLPLERGMTISGGFETSLALKLVSRNSNILTKNILYIIYSFVCILLLLLRQHNND